MNTLQKHIFISYSRRDKTVMKRVVSFLHNQELRVWVDDEKLKSGTTAWEEEIEEAIPRAAVIVVLLSPSSAESIWVQREIKLALLHKIKIIPVLIKDYSSAYSFLPQTKPKEYIDIRGSKEKRGLAHLKNRLIDLANSISSNQIESKTFIQTSEHLTQGIFSILRMENIIGLLLVWGISWAIGGIIGWEVGQTIGVDVDVIAAGLLTGTFGGLGTGIIFRREEIIVKNNKIPLITLAWATAIAIGWGSSFSSIGMLGFLLGAVLGGIGTALVLKLEINMNFKKIMFISLGWLIGEIAGLILGGLISIIIGLIIAIIFSADMGIEIGGLLVGIFAGAITGAIGGGYTIFLLKQ
ncbi:MAG: toll/interleukin-1 receptor domain-containing protein [Chloroflexi bacterium]|nr:toll/interleukin-1 receptor domain-containing protein [Chloroflexota bacterium]